MTSPLDDLSEREAWLAGITHIQAIGAAISDLLNDERLDDETKARIVAWSWHVAAIADGCEATRLDLSVPNHMVWPHGRRSVGGNVAHVYLCQVHGGPEWPCCYHQDMLNRLPAGWKL